MKSSWHLHYHLLTASAVCLLTGFGATGWAEHSRPVHLLKEDGDTVSAQPGMNRGDMEITRQIRMNLVGDEHLSTLAKNVKIITNNGHVILRGPVHSQAEVLRVLRNADAIAGASHVSNEMKISK
jgi:osmotically-inducible protein OsmY